MFTRRRFISVIALALTCLVVMTVSSFATSTDFEGDSRISVCADTDCSHNSLPVFDDFTTHYIVEPIIHVYDEPILVERIVTYQDELLADFDANGETRSIICPLCDLGTLGWAQIAQGQPQRGPEHSCCHKLPRGTDDTYYRNDQWAYRCGRCGYVARTEIRTVTLAEQCYGRP